MDVANHNPEAEVSLQRLTEIVVSNLVSCAERAGGVEKVSFGSFVGSMAGGYEDLGVALDMRFTSSMIAAWCGFAGVEVPAWCVVEGGGIKVSVNQGRMFREMTGSVVEELRKHGKSINDKDVTIIARRAKVASA